MIRHGKPGRRRGSDTLRHLSAAAGIALVVMLAWYATDPYGSGVSPDSVRYLRIAEAIRAKGLPTILLSRELSALQPPLYPAALALTARLLAMPLLPAARFLNIFLLGVALALTVRLYQRISPAPAAGMPVAVALAATGPLFTVSLMIWSEPLSIVCTLACLLTTQAYLHSGRHLPVCLAAAATMAAVYTRYDALALAASTLVCVLLVPGRPLRVRLRHSVVYFLLLMPPVGLLLWRNLHICGTLMGARSPSRLGMIETLQQCVATVSGWLLPEWAAARLTPFAPALLLAAATLLIHPVIRCRLRQWISNPAVAPLVVFCLTVPGCLVFAATRVGMDTLNDRLLAGVSVPLACLLGLEMQRLCRANLACVLAALCICALPLGRLARTTADARHNGVGGFTTATWHHSATIAHLRTQPLHDHSRTLYSNAPGALYTLLQMHAQAGPRRTRHVNARGSICRLDEIPTRFPSLRHAYLVWFDRCRTPDRFPPQQLGRILEVRPVARLADGTIYTIDGDRG